MLGVSRNATISAIRGETGHVPILIRLASPLLKFVFRVSKMPLDSLVYKGYLDCLQMAQSSNMGWLSGVKELLDHVKNRTIWPCLLSHAKIDKPKMLCKQITSALMNEYIGTWKNIINNGISSSRRAQVDSSGGNKLRTYCTFKNSYHRENYLVMIKRKDIRRSLTRLRISAHNLMIETGRHLKLNIVDRVCPTCGVLEDELHFVTSCSMYEAARDTLYKHVINISPVFAYLTPQEKCMFLMNKGSSDFQIVTHLAAYVHDATELRIEYSLT